MARRVADGKHGVWKSLFYSLCMACVVGLWAYGVKCQLLFTNRSESLSFIVARSHEFTGFANVSAVYKYEAKDMCDRLFQPAGKRRFAVLVAVSVVGVVTD